MGCARTELIDRIEIHVETMAMGQVLMISYDFLHLFVVHSSGILQPSEWDFYHGVYVLDWDSRFIHKPNIDDPSQDHQEIRIELRQGKRQEQ